MFRSLLATVSILVLALPATAGDWSRFRGANGAGVSSASAPTALDLGRNVAWVAEVPFGRSSPVIAGDRIYMTAVEDGALVTLAIDRASGERLWTAKLEPGRSAEFHHDTDSSTPTPVTDGKNVYVFFQEFGLVSYNRKGKERWRMPLGPFRNFYSIAASPVIAGRLLYMVCDQAEGSFVVAVDTKSGKQQWRVERPARLEAYATPIVYPAAGKPRALIVSGSGWVDAYDPVTGASLWSLGDVGTGPVPSPVLVDDVLYVTAPDHGENGWAPFAGVAEEFDKDGSGGIDRTEAEAGWVIQHFGWLDVDADGSIDEKDWTEIGSQMLNDKYGVWAIRLSAAAAPEKLWNYRKNVADIATPLVHDGVFYMVRDRVMTSLDADTGEVIKRDRVAEGATKVYASPVAAGGKLYLGTLEGTLLVVNASGEWETETAVDLDDEIWATPAIADGRLYVRTRGKLYAFGDAGE